MTNIKSYDEMVSLLDTLRNTSSSNKKIEILSEYKDCELVKKFMRFTYDPFILFGSFKSRIDKIAGSMHSKDVNGSDSLYPLVEIETVIRSILSSKENTHEMIDREILYLNEKLGCIPDLFYMVITKTFDIGMNASSINKALGKDTIPDFKVQLSNPITEKVIKEWPAQFYVTPKLDGIRCLYMNGRLYSRQGKEFTGLEHIEEQCKRLEEISGIACFDGELMIPNESFNRTQSVISDKDTDCDKSIVVYNIFALPMFDGGTHNMNYKLVIMDSWKSESILTNTPDLCPNINYIYSINEREEGPWHFSDWSEILDCIDHYIKLGYEGAMFRSPKLAYDWKRSNALMKGKKFDTITLQIMDWKEGTGKYKGMMGAVSCHGFSNDGREIMCEVGSGWSDEDRSMFNDNYIGKMIDVRYQEITKSKDSEIYSLRFPTFDRFRLDMKSD